MGLRIKAEIDTVKGPTSEAYIRIESIQLNRLFGTITVGITIWLTRDDSEEAKNTEGQTLEGLLGNKVVLYRNSQDLGTEIEIPMVHKFSMRRPKVIRVPIYENREYFEEIPYKQLSPDGIWETCYKTEKVTERVLVGEKTETTQVLNLKLESNLVSWCYGQLKVALGDVIPIDLLEDVEE